MQSLKINKSGEFIEITGFQNRPIDPQETRKQSAAAIIGTDELTELKNKQEEQYRYILRSQEARKKAIYHLSLADEGNDVEKNKISAAAQDKIADDLVGNINTCNEDLKPLALACTEKSKDILRNSPIFFEARGNEVIKTEEEITDLLTKFAAKTENQALLEDGTYIDDFRGKVYHEKTGDTWAETIIESLGVVKETDTKYTDELTDSEKIEIAEQKETERIDALTEEEKTAEYDIKVAELLAETVVMRSELEIQGASTDDALKQSQDFYNAEIADLKTIYGVT